MEMRLRIVGKIISCCFAALFAVTSTLNIYASVQCVEEGEPVKMELVCSPYYGSDVADSPKESACTVEGDQARCDDCNDFPAEELARPPRLSMKFVDNNLSVSSSLTLLASAAGLEWTGGYSILPATNRGHSKPTHAYLEITVLRC